MKTYTLDELKTYWKDYETRKVMRILRQGKWEIEPLNKRGTDRIDGTKAELVKVNKVKTFPEYLESL